MVATDKPPYALAGFAWWRCGTCVYRDVVMIDGDPIHGDPGGISLECHRHPPALVVLDGVPAVVWPQVDADDACGDWHGPRPRNEVGPV